MADEKLILRAIDQLTEPRRGGRRAEVIDESVAQAQQVLADENTVGVGMGYKEKGGKITDELVLQYFVKKKRRSRELRAAEAVPIVLEVAGESCPTDVVEVGEVVPEVLAQRKPLQPGYSIGHVKVTAGTFGAVVTKGRKYHILSNSHVLALSGKAKRGDRIIYPGRVDGGKNPADTAGTLAAFKQFKKGGAFVNTADCAIARVALARLKDLRSDIKGLGVPKGETTAKLRMQVTKTGRTTATTTGRVLSTNARIVINYQGVGPVGFRDQVRCTRYTKPGDSGSLVLDKRTKKAVGLHFAGGPTSSFFNPLSEVKKALRFQLVTKRIAATTRAGGTPQETSSETLPSKGRSRPVRRRRRARRVRA